MNIKRLFIRDFGIFNNQLIDDINSGIVVVGGLNRAGKTTFLHILRHLAYGFPRRENFPPAREKHEVEAIIDIDSNEIVNVHLKGFAEPKVSSVDSFKDYNSLRNIYGGLDSFTYHQLFTISLDELQINIDNKEIEKLQSIFLGAGLKEFILLPQIEELFSKEADKIGGTKGDPKVREFKPYYKQIKDALLLREKASNQLSIYQEKKAELANVEDSIKEYQDKINIRENELKCLDILMSNYNSYKKIKELESRINISEVQECLNDNKYYYPERASNILVKYQNKRDEINRKKSILKQKMGIESIDTIKANYNTYKKDIKVISEKYSGIKEKIRFVQQKDNEISEIENDLKIALNDVNEDWKGDLKKIKHIKTDEISLVDLQEKINKHQKISFKLEEANEKSLELEERKNQLLQSMDSLKVREPKKRLKSYFLISIGFIGVGAALSFINTFFALLPLTGILGLSIYYFYIYSLDRGYLTYKESSASEVHDLEHKILSLEKKIKKYKTKLEPLGETLSKYKVSFGLTNDSSVELIKEFFRVIKDTKSKFSKLEDDKKLLASEKEQLENDLKHMYKTLANFNEIISLESIDKEKLYQESVLLFTQFEQLMKCLNDISDHFTLEEEILEIKKEAEELFEDSAFVYNPESNIINSIEEYMNLSRIKNEYLSLQREFNQVEEQFKAIFNTEMIHEIFENYFQFNKENFDLTDFGTFYQRIRFLYDRYISLDNLEAEYNSTKESLFNTKEDLKNLNKREQNLKNNLLDLSSDEKLKKASIIIDESRQDLSLLAEKYAVNKTAEYILKKVRETFIEQTKNKLLSGASQYFKKITNGEYKAILPVENIMKGDFQALLSDGNVQDSTGTLSRGTSEQLFLAVRINRIREIKPALPVIVDDSFVNFDNFHLAETVKILKELSKTHQIFVLTCHPHFINLFEDDHNTQYWQLDKGHFAQTSKNDLINYLQRR
ncbi:ATP-binding protein [Natronospora cellulosivora (SeqCode)]